VNHEQGTVGEPVSCREGAIMRALSGLPLDDLRASARFASARLRPFGDAISTSACAVRAELVGEGARTPNLRAAMRRRLRGV